MGLLLLTLFVKVRIYQRIYLHFWIWITKLEYRVLQNDGILIPDLVDTPRFVTANPVVVTGQISITKIVSQHDNNLWFFHVSKPMTQSK